VKAIQALLVDVLDLLTALEKLLMVEAVLR
jgi:hypothetical protein